MIQLSLTEYEAALVQSALYFHAQELTKSPHTFNQAVEVARIMALVSKATGLSTQASLMRQQNIIC